MKATTSKRVLTGMLAIILLLGFCIRPEFAATAETVCTKHNWSDGTCTACGVIGIEEASDLQAFLGREDGGNAVLLQSISAANDSMLFANNHTLDLNGYALTAKAAIVLGESCIVDNSATQTGSLIVPRSKLNIFGDNAGILPVWDPVDGQYIFTKIVYQKLVQLGADGVSVRYIFMPNFTNTRVTELLADGGTDNGIRIKAEMTWNNGTCEQFYTFSDVDVAQVYSSFKGSVASMVFMLTITGVAGIEDAEISAQVVSDRGGKSVCPGTALPVLTPKYTVTFKDHNGIVLKTETVEASKAATAPAVPTRAGYRFTGWDKAYNTITQNLVVTAQYSIAHNQLYFAYRDNGDGTLTATLTACGDVNFFGLAMDIHLRSLVGLQYSQVTASANGASVNYKDEKIIVAYTNVTGRNNKAETQLLEICFNITGSVQQLEFEITDVDIFDDAYNDETYHIANSTFEK